MAVDESKFEEMIRRRFVGDPLSNYPASIQALVFYEKVCWDSDRLMSDPRAREIARLLIRAVGSVSANFEEGYGRGSSKDFVYHLGISRGEAREAKGWIWKGRRWFGEALTEERMKDADQVIAGINSVTQGIQRNQ